MHRFNKLYHLRNLKQTSCRRLSRGCVGILNSSTATQSSVSLNSVRRKSQLSDHHHHGYMTNPVDLSKLQSLESENQITRISLQNFNDLQSQGIARLVEAYRIHGHKKATTNPLSVQKQPQECQELRPENYGFDMDSTIPIENGGSTTISDLVNDLERIFCGRISIETSQLNTSVEKDYMSLLLAQVIEEEISDEERITLARNMIRSQGVDNFIDLKFKTVKRYGGEGAESMVAFTETLFKEATALGNKQIILGMPHRGRLNLLVSQLKFPPEILFRKMQGLSEFPEEVLSVATGDVISHLTTSVDLEQPSGTLHVTMVPPPSHLEAVNPVVMGKCYARQQTLSKNEDSEDVNPLDKALCFLMHGDAAFAGQGIVAECINMSNLPHFSVGGTIHLIVNNQLGFTTPSTRGRSSLYTSDIGKITGCPVIHVNGDFPEDVIRAAKMAIQYRQMFYKDVIVDLQCFRRHGHNEMDDPSFTQPIMYEEIETRQTVPDKYAQDLVDSGLLTSAELAQWKGEMQTELGEKLKNAESYIPTPSYLAQHWATMSIPDPSHLTHWDTGYPVDSLRYIGVKSIESPEDLKVHDRLMKMYANVRSDRMETVGPIDWATAETLAVGSLLQQDYDVRFCGQDVGRGTFSHRHATLICQDSEDVHVPLNHVVEEQKGRIEVVNSLLSEEAVLGFEYGMSIENPNRLVIWEAQFGDFFNGAQIILDTFVNSGEAKWMLQSGLVVLLPHGYDGMGPEHSSCKIERFLQMTNSKEDGIDGDGVNVHFCNPSTPAQYFHLLRRQMIRNYRKPLIIASPKTLLRSPDATSQLSEMAPGTFFKPVLTDPSITDPNKIEKLIFCSGKHYYTLATERARLGQNDTTALVRVEELCPFPTEALRKEVATFSNVKSMIWAQEEPRNMGPWSFVAPRFENKVGIKLKYAGRPVLPTPAVGIGKLHRAQMEQILVDAFK